MIRVSGTVQIAGIRSLGEARMILGCGVDVLGFPLRLDVHQEDMDETQAARVIQSLGVPERCLLITYEKDPGKVVGLVRGLGVGGIQMHGDISPGATARIAASAPKLALIKSLVVGRYAAADLLEQVRDFSPHVEAFITDTFDPATGASGATGRTHDWTVSRSLVQASPKPVILAGGLNPDNVADAIAAVRPAGVDAHTGVEDREGWKDEAKVELFVARAREAFVGLSGHV